MIWGYHYFRKHPYKKLLNRIANSWALRIIMGSQAHEKGTDWREIQNPKITAEYKTHPQEGPRWVLGRVDSQNNSQAGANWWKGVFFKPAHWFRFLHMLVCRDQLIREPHFRHQQERETAAKGSIAGWLIYLLIDLYSNWLDQQS